VLWLVQARGAFGKLRLASRLCPSSGLPVSEAAVKLWQCFLACWQVQASVGSHRELLRGVPDAAGTTHNKRFKGRRLRLRRSRALNLGVGPKKMIRTLLVTTTIAALAVSGCRDHTSIQSGSELIGSWEWTLPDSGCRETYTYKSDGTATIASGPVMYEDRYKIATQPLANGRFKLEAETYKQSPGVSCVGVEKDYVGKPYEVYVELSSDKRSMVMYGSPDGSSGVGPLHRVNK